MIFAEQVISARGERVPGERPGETVETRAESIFKVSLYVHQTGPPKLKMNRGCPCLVLQTDNPAHAIIVAE